MSRRHELTDEQWERLKDLLPPQKPHTGRPSHDHRTMVNGMLWIARTGAPWRDLPERYGKWPSVYSRFQRWRKAGVWARLLSELQQLGDQRSELNWEIHFVDGSIVRAHQHAAGAKKHSTSRSPRAWTRGIEHQNPRARRRQRPADGFRPDTRPAA